MGDCEVKIPKRIMQTWKGPESTLPEAWKESPVSIRTMMPDWEYILMTDEDNDRFIAKHFPQYLDAFRGFKYGIQRADFIRYAWLAAGGGGLYLDCDYRVDKPLDELFYVDREFYVCPSGNFSDYYTNAIMASKPGVDIWLRCLELAVQGAPWWAIGKHLYVMTSTGPLMFSKAVRETNPSRYHILNSRLLTPCSVCDPKPCTKDGGYLTTLPGSSWVQWDTLAAIYTKCHWRQIMILLSILIVVFVVIVLLRAYRMPRESRKALKK
jgi:mannosyltransferase OCH1-like enzyme